MTLDLKLPRWLASLIAIVWCASLIENIVCQAINARANLHYLSGANGSPPPPYPGHPEMQPNEPEQRALPTTKPNRPHRSRK